MRTDGYDTYGSAGDSEASNNKLYGLARVYGSNGVGQILFEYDFSNSIYTKLHDFFCGAADGSGPYGSLMQASDGYLYGMTTTGGILDSGTIFKYDIGSGNLTKLYDFTNSSGKNLLTGNLIQATNGKLYGMTSDGGANAFGTIFQLDPVSLTFTTFI